MEIVTQLSIFMENKTGTLARVCEALAAHAIQILGFSILETSEHGIVRAVVSDPIRAIHVLGEGGMLVIERDILSVPAPNRPGVLGEIARALAKSRVNVLYGYGSTPGKSRAGQFYLAVSNPQKALAVLGG